MKLLLLTLLIFCSFGYAQVGMYIEPLHSVEAFSSPVRAGVGDATNGLIIVCSQNKTIKVYDARNLAQRTLLDGGNVPISSILFLKQASTLCVAYSTGKIDLWDIMKEEIKPLDVSNSTVVSMAEAPQQRILIASFDRIVKLVDVRSGKILSSSNSLSDGIVAVGTDLTGSNAVVVSEGGLVRYLGLPDLNELRKSDANGRVLRAAFSPDAKWIALTGPEGAVRLFDAAAGIVRAFFTESRQLVSSLAFDPKNRWLVASSCDSTLRVYDLSRNSLAHSVPVPAAYITTSSFMGPEMLWYGTTKGTVSTWGVHETPPDTLSPVMTLAQSDGPRRVFGSSARIAGLVRDENAIKEILVDKGNGVLKVADAEEKDRVPGMVSKSFLLDATLDKMGDNAFSIHATDKFGNVARTSFVVKRLTNEEAVEIVNPPNNFEAEKGSTKLEFKLWCQAASYQVFVNMAEVSGNRNVQQRKLGDPFSEDIPLSVGYNQVQINVVLNDGQKITKTLGVNRKMYGAVVAAPAANPASKQRGVEPQLWAVVVGVSEYANKAIPSLHFADRDAEAFAEFLQRPEGGGIQPDHMHLLINKDATLANLKEALVEFLAQAIDKDLVIIFFAGHGAPDPARPANLYLLTHDTDPSKLGTSAYPMWDMQTLLTRQLTAKRIVVFSDACHSGGISVDFATRGVKTTESNLINQYLADLARTKEGIVMFTASAAGEVSQEFPDLGHGVFTYYLLQGMKGEADLNNDYTVTINELMQYVEDQVKRKTKGAQNPTRSQTMYDKELTISKVAH